MVKDSELPSRSEDVMILQRLLSEGSRAIGERGNE